VSDGAFRDDIYRGQPFLEWQSSQGKLTQKDLAKRRRDQEERINRPHLVRTGPAEFSTCMGVQPWPCMVWDVNGYYVELGIHWSATHKQIKEAYQAKHGERSVRLTFIVKQLLDAQVRRNYDSVTLGSIFFDKYVAEFVKEQMHKDHLKEYGRSLPIEEQLSEGAEKIDLNKYLNKDFALDMHTAGEVGSNRWRWGWYSLKTSIIDIDKLRDWQQILVQVWSPSKLLSIGLSEGGEEAFVQRIGYRLVVFIDVQAKPTIELANRVYLKHLLEKA
jgi:hypothetical protein